MFDEKKVDWESTGLLNGISDDKKMLVSSMLDNQRELVIDDKSIDENIRYGIFAVARRCFDLSGITDVQWLVKDYQLWCEENKEMISNLRCQVYMKLDGEVELIAMYSDIHGNRYLKQHNGDKAKQRDELINSIKNIIEEFGLTEDKPSSTLYPTAYWYQSGLQTVTDSLKELLEKFNNV